MSNSTLKRPKGLRNSFSGPAHVSKSALAIGLSTAIASTMAVAQEEDTIMLDKLSIEDRTIDTNPYAEPGAPYKAKVSGDKRRVKPLAETPQTITVLTQTAIKESGASDLKDIVSSQPGVTLGTGENGNAFGDRYIIRGHEARSDVFVDGLRDPGMTTRESFATEQVEITKGPSSTFAGRGSTGGAVNSITKQASNEYSFTKLEAGIGTDDFRRLTLDTNQKINDDLSVRVNLLHGYEEVPDRSPADKERNGIALSAAYKVNEKLTLVADYYRLEAEDNPDVGTYTRENGRPVKNIPVYLQGEDFLESEIETFTFRAGYQVNDQLRIENATRYGTTENGYVITGARGPFEAGDPVELTTHDQWQDVDYFVNQLNVFWDTSIGGAKHQFIFTAEYSDLEVANGRHDITNNGATNCMVFGFNGMEPGYCLADADNNYVANPRSLLQRSVSRNPQKISDFNVETISLSIMDTITLNDKWDLFLGIRLDDFDYSNFGEVFDEDDFFAPPTLVNFEYDDTLWNGHIGVVYKINKNANIYLTYSTSSNINGGESDTGTSCGYGGICGANQQQVRSSEPEDTENFELGTKWNILDEKLLFTATIFQITKDDVMESVGSNDYATLGTLNTGKNRVQGAEISLVGNITDKLSTQFGYTHMDSEVLESFDNDNEGKELSNFANESLYLQLRYQITDKLSLGGVATYSSSFVAGQPDTANDGDFTVPSYTKFDLFATYKITDKLQTRLNIGNVTDKDYYLAAYRSGAFTYIGDARNAQLTVSYEF